MASEMRRIARALVSRREESFASRYSERESIARVQAALRGFDAKRMRYATAWRDEAGRAKLEVEMSPSPGTDRLLKAISVALTLLLLASAWAMVSPLAEGAAAFLVPLLTALAILAFPFAVVALGSQRESEEARLIRAVRRAIVDEER
jgi:hypothetical protein